MGRGHPILWEELINTILKNEMVNECNYDSKNQNLSVHFSWEVFC